MSNDLFIQARATEAAEQAVSAPFENHKALLYMEDMTEVVLTENVKSEMAKCDSLPSLHEFIDKHKSLQGNKEFNQLFYKTKLNLLRK